MYKLLKILFVLLLFLTITEAGYYIYVLKYPIKPAQNNPSLAPSISSDQKIEQLRSSSSIVPQVTQTNLPTIQPLISSDSITYLQNMKFVKNKTIVVTIEESGYVDTIQLQPKGSATELKLVDENGTIISAISRDLEFWNKNLFKKIANSDVPFSITDLKKGDFIMHSYQMNITDNTDNHKYVVISK